MKSLIFVIAFVAPILVSCSTYKEVSLMNFKEYEITSNDRLDQHYVLKTHKLHYSDINRIVHNHYYEVDESTPYVSHSESIEDNIVIPTGASGVCVHTQDDHFIIDFGKGVEVPFIVLQDDNRAKKRIEVDERTYRLLKSKRQARLFFDTRNLRRSGERMKY